MLLSTSRLSHHSFKVESRVRIPLGVQHAATSLEWEHSTNYLLFRGLNCQKPLSPKLSYGVMVTRQVLVLKLGVRIPLGQQ